MASVLVDTGPIVAFLHEGERHHDWAVEQFSTLPLPFITCEAVIVEATFLLQRLSRSHEKLLGLIASGALLIGFDLEREAEVVSALMTQYSNVPMALADACLVRMAEQHAKSTVLKLDSYFLIYRKHRREVISVIFP